ncbi:hypothetical protein M3Y98_00515900 [Aphelenchoides besseyi]|nr:hypothetical protein M3Y98_00515900 [Aphelenchoides besseyi]
MEPTGVVGDLKMPVDAASPIMTNASQTEIRVEYIKHNWTVKNFSHWLVLSLSIVCLKLSNFSYQEYLENYVHLPRGDENLTWSIKIYPKGNGENNKDFVFLCLNRVLNCSAKNKVGFRSRFYLKNNEGKDIEMRIHPNPSHSDFVSYIKRDVLFPQIQPADSITVFVEIDVAVETITTTADDHLMGRQKCECERPLGDDYLRLLKDSIHTDFTIRVGVLEIQVHKAILAARSPVFAAMLTHPDTNEAKTGVLNIEDVDYAVVKEMMHFLYAGRCSPDMPEMASELLIAADKYRLEDLKSDCEKILIQNLTLAESCNVLILADTFNAEKLKQRALQMILHHSAEVTGTSGWEILLKDHSHLVTDIVRSFDKSSRSSGDGNLINMLSGNN